MRDRAQVGPAPGRIAPPDRGELLISGHVERLNGSPAAGVPVLLDITEELTITKRSGECTGDRSRATLTTGTDGTFEHRIRGGGPSRWLCVEGRAIAPGGSESSDVVRTRVFDGAQDLGPKTADLRLVLQPRVSPRCVPADTTGYRSASARLVAGAFTYGDARCYVALRGDPVRRQYECGKVIVLLEDAPGRVEALARSMHAWILGAAVTGCHVRVSYAVYPGAIRQALETASASTGVLLVDVNYVATIERDEKSQAAAERRAVTRPPAELLSAFEQRYDRPAPPPSRAGRDFEHVLVHPDDYPSADLETLLDGLERIGLKGGAAGHEATIFLSMVGARSRPVFRPTIPGIFPRLERIYRATDERIIKMAALEGMEWVSERHAALAFLEAVLVQDPSEADFPESASVAFSAMAGMARYGIEDAKRVLKRLHESGAVRDPVARYRLSLFAAEGYSYRPDGSQ